MNENIGCESSFKRLESVDMSVFLEICYGQT